MPDPQHPPVPSPASLVRIEAEALLHLADRLDGQDAASFEAALTLAAATLQSGAKLVLTGAGKSGLIARKLTSTLLSFGLHAVFLHPAEAVHGDLGLLRPGDLVLALSYSGETEELLRLLPALRNRQLPVLAFTGCPGSTLGKAAAVVLNVQVEREACHHDLAPTASTTAMLALGDALAVTLAQRLGAVAQTFAELHPGGQLGRRLRPIRELMHTGDAIPAVPADAPMSTVIHEMSAKRLGMTTVQDPLGRPLGVISDGDLRRLFEHAGPQAFHRTALQVMNPHPRTVRLDLFAADALDLMEAHKITALVLTADGTPATPVQGVLHLHDLVQALAAH